MNKFMEINLHIGVLLIDGIFCVPFELSCKSKWTKKELTRFYGCPLKELILKKRLITEMSSIGKTTEIFLKKVYFSNRITNLCAVSLCV